MGAVLDHLVAVMAFCLLVAAPVPLGLCAAMLRAKETERLSLPQALMVVLSVWCVVQALVAHGLGLLHQLHYPAVLLVETALLGGGAICASRFGSRGLRLPPIAAKPLETLALLTLAFMALTLLWWCAAMPVVDFDSWAFHMSHMAQWLQTGSFTRVVAEAHRPRNSYPYGWEALCTPFLLPFGEDMLVTFPNLIAWALLGLAIYLLARHWRARRDHALACATLLLAIHYVADVVNSMHVDVPFAALLLAGAWWGAIYARSGAAVPMVLAATTVALACATRVTGPVYAVALAAWLVLVRITEREPSGSRPRPNPRPMLLGGLAAAITLGGFWYAKNLIEIGHILGSGAPKQGSAAVHGSWTYYANSTLAFSVQPLEMSSWRAVFDRSFAELEAPFVAIVALAALWPLAMLAPQRRGGAADLTLALLVAGTGALFWLTPLSALTGIQVRLGIPFLACLAIAAAVGATWARLPGEVPVALALIGATRTFSSSRVLYPLVLLLVGWGVWRARSPLSLPRRLRAVLVAGVLLLAIAGVTAAARERRERERRSVYGPFYEALEQNLSPSEPAAYLLSARPYLFYGRRLARTVVYAPLAEGDDVREWAEALRRQRIRFVALGPWSGDDRRERATVERLTGAGSPLRPLSGRGAPGEITLFALDP